MPRRAIASENRVGSGGSQFPKIKFQNKGERKRILLIDEPWQEYVHYIKEPVLIDGVKPKMETKKKPRSEEEYEDYETSLLSMALCLGDPSVIEAEGYDAKNCPACAVVKEAPAEARISPVLRFAANVVDYTLKPGTWNVQKPFSASVKIWNFTSNMYDELVSLQEQNGDLIRVKDVTLECTNAVFQQVKMGVMQTPGWQELNAGSQLAELLAEPGNVATDDQLKDSCGRTVKRSFMEDDVALSLRKWRKAIAYTEGTSDLSGAALGGGASTVQEGVSALLNDPSVKAADAEAAEQREKLIAAARAADEAEAAAKENPTEAAAPQSEPASEPQETAGSQTAPPSDDPFAVLGGSRPSATPSAASAESSPAAQEAPATTQTAPPPSDAAQKLGFDDLVKNLGGA